MSNLGYYVKITAFIKQVGGPTKFRTLVSSVLVAVGAAGVAVGAAGKTQFDKRRRKGNAPTSSDVVDGPIYRVTEAAQLDGDLRLEVGDAFQEIWRDSGDTDIVMISIIGNEKNPYIASADALARISDFPRNTNEPGNVGA